MIRRAIVVLAIAVATVPVSGAVAAADPDPLETPRCIVTAIKHGEDWGYRCLYPEP